MAAAAAASLQQAFARLITTVGAIISEAYTMGFVGALEDLAGLDPKLTARMLDLEVQRIERESLFVQAITAEVSKAIVGQQYLVNRLLVRRDLEKIFAFRAAALQSQFGQGQPA